MNSFKSAYTNSRQSVNEDRRREIDAQHERIVSAIRESYGVNSFSDLTDAERASFRTMVLEMWNPTTGITSKGEKFLNEGKRILTGDSTQAEIKREFTKEITATARDFVDGKIGREQLYVAVRGAKLSIEEKTSKPMSKRNVREWLAKVLGDLVVGVAKDLKF